ncbi:MAG: argininosuccinate lyase [Saprospiraceae bacterium]|nr:argininosuccinate lyase [Saprospiraceae bacterium]
MKILAFLSFIFLSIGLSAFKIAEKPVSNMECLLSEAPNLDFVLVNKTGYDIENIYVAPTKQQTWGDDIMGRDLLEDGESVEVSFDPGEKTKKWDIYVTWLGYESDEDRYWTGLDLSEISEITLFYDDKSGKTWAEWK